MDEAATTLFRAVPHARAVSSLRRLHGRVSRTWRTFRSSLLFIPVILTATAVALFFVTGIADERIYARGTPGAAGDGMGPVDLLVFAGSPSAAREVLSTVAGTWATIAGVAYSVTLVTVTLAATKYSAQVIPAFENDKLNQVTLGAFTGTVVYSLLLLKTVRSPGETSDAGFVPVIGVNVAIVLAVASLFLFIWFISNLTAYIRPTRFVDDLASGAIRCLHLARLPDGVEGFEAAREEERPVRSDARAVHLKPEYDGVLTSIDWKRVARAVGREARRHPERVPDLVEVEVRQNTSVSDDTSIVSLKGDGASPHLGRKITGAFELSQVANLRDAPYAATSIGDVGITALSGGSTDVGVAKNSISALLRIATADLEQPPVSDVFRLRVGPQERTVWVTRPVSAPYKTCLREATRVFGKARREGYWDVGEAVAEAQDALVRAAANTKDRGPWDDVLDWLRPVLHQLLRFEDEASVRRVVEKLHHTHDHLQEEGRHLEAVEYAAVLDEAFTQAPRERRDILPRGDVPAREADR